MTLLRTAFDQELNPAVANFLSSIEADKALVNADIKGSIAHSTMLNQVGLISEDKKDKIVDGLKLIQSKYENGELEFDDQLEDVHMNVEAELEQLIGIDAKHLHTARSRNDQVSLDTRLFVKEQTDQLISLINTVKTNLLDAAEHNLDAVMPGYTHLQRAQPVSFAHVMLAFISMFDRDQSRFIEARKRASISPLGACAIAGTSLPISPEFTSSVLGLTETFGNSIDAVCDRDFAADFLYASAMTSIHLSQLAETLIIWATSEFGFITFPDSLTTTSSLMPQKKNPDPLEIIRGKTGYAVGELVNLLVTLKALPIGYNRDLQETKPPVINVSQSLKAALEVAAVAIANIQICKSAMFKAASDPNLMATDLVEYLVKKKVAFRHAHEIVAALVQHAKSQGRLLSALTIAEFKSFAYEFEDDVLSLFDPVKSINSKTSPGGTSPVCTAQAISVVRNNLLEDKS